MSSVVQHHDAVSVDVQRAALKAAGFERSDPAVVTVVVEMAKRYKLELMLRHLLPIEGKPFITRDGLLHVAHMNGNLDGIVLEEEGETGPGAWWAIIAVYRKDMKHPFRYKGRYNGPNKKFGPEMAVKCAEAMALRRAFDVSIPSEEEYVHGGDSTVETRMAPSDSRSSDLKSLQFMDLDKKSRLRAIAEVGKIPAPEVARMTSAAVGGRKIESKDGVPLLTQAEYETLVGALKSWKAPAESQAEVVDETEAGHAG